MYFPAIEKKCNQKRVRIVLLNGVVGYPCAEGRGTMVSNCTVAVVLGWIFKSEEVFRVSLFDNFVNIQEKDIQERHYQIAKVGLLVSLLLHLVFLVSFSLLQVTLLAWFNVLSVVVLGAAIYYNGKREFYMAYTFAYVEVLSHQVLATVLLGWESGFHFYISFCIVGPLLMAKGYRIWKGITLGGAFAAYLLLFFYSRMFGPLVSLNSVILSLFGTLNIIGFILLLIIVIYLFHETVYRYELAIDNERKHATSLLGNIFPKSISQRLEHEKSIADGFSDASVLFADIVGFTRFCDTVSPERLVSILDNLFERFDRLTDRYECEKIKTIGDSYMVVCGIPEVNNAHAQKIIQFGLGMINELAEFNREQNLEFLLRIGVNSGPVVAGVIGTKKFSYDLWGATVNMASRMESTGVANKIQVTGSTRDAANGFFNFHPRGSVFIKGLGETETFLVEPL